MGPASMLYRVFGYVSTSLFTVTSVLARQPSRAADPLLRSSRGGEGDPPLCIGKQEVGTYIYSLLYTHTGFLGRLLLKFNSR